MEPSRVREDDRLESIPNVGSMRIMNPVERCTPLPRSVAVYQPIFQLFCEQEDGAKYLASDWVKERTAKVGLGYGKPFLAMPDSIEIYPDEESCAWVLSDTWTKGEILSQLPRYVHARIRRSVEHAVRLISSRERRKRMRKQVAMAGMVDRAILRKSSEALRRPPNIA
jgi:hypothetical protein